MNKRCVFCLLLTALWVCLLAVPILPVDARASTTVVDGVEVTIRTNQEEYADDEAISVTIQVTNTTENKVTIENLEQMVPQGYTLSENSMSSLTKFDLAAGETRELTVEMLPIQETEPEETVDALEKVLDGETMGIPNVILILVMFLFIAIFYFFT